MHHDDHPPEQWHAIGAAVSSSIDCLLCSNPPGSFCVRRVEAGERDFARPAPAMRADDPEGDAEQVGAQRPRRVQRCPMAMQHHEHLLREVLDLAWTRPEPPQRLEQVVELSVVRLEATALRRRHGRSRMNESKISHEYIQLSRAPDLFIEIARRD